MRIGYVLLLAAVAGTLVFAGAAASEERKAPKALTVSGILASVEGSAITVSFKKDEGRTEGTKTVTVDAETKILIETNEMESKPGEGGKIVQRPKVVEGTLADLKVGQRVTVTCTAETGKAIKVFVSRTPPKENKEGERGPRPPRKPEGSGSREK
jgi:hypothetical protein